MFRIFECYNKPPSSNSAEMVEDCIHVFAPAALIKLYRQLQDYIGTYGKAAPSTSYLPDSVTTSLLAWTGTGATMQPYAQAAIAAIEKHLKAELNTLLNIKEDVLEKAENFSTNVLKDVYLATREMPKILREMPAESITVPLIKPGSEVRRHITAVVSHYQHKLMFNGFPADLDIHLTDDNRLAHLLKNYK